MEMFDGFTRPLRALLIALRFRVSVIYARKLLEIMDRAERGQMTAQEFLRAGVQLGEQYPDDYKRARKGRNSDQRQ